MGALLHLVDSACLNAPQPMDCGLVEITRKDHVKLPARSIFKAAQKMKNTLKASMVDEQVAVNTISSSTIENEEAGHPMPPPIP